MTNNKKKYIPKLRFPEFQNNGEWNNVLIGDIIKIVTPQKKVPTLEYRKIGLFPIIDQSLKHIAGYSDDKTALLNIHKCDYIIFGDHTCSIKLINFPFIQGADGIKIFYSNNQCLHTHFLYQYLLAYPIHPNGYKRHFSELKEQTIFYPTNIQEQKKIAGCLSSLDTYIDTTKRKLELLKEYKKGLMQQLFPTPGKNIPELRFPEFSGKWQEKRLGDSFDERNEKNRGDLPLLSLGDKGLLYQCDTNRKDNSNANKSKYLRVAFGDIAYNTMRMWQGRCVFVDKEGIVSPAYTVCHPKEGVDSMFHYYLFKTYKMIDLFHQNSQGLVSDTLNLKFETFSKIKYFIPPSLTEQKKIADFLSKLDALIISEIKQIETLEVHKKGLMQRLFP